MQSHADFLRPFDSRHDTAAAGLPGGEIEELDAGAAHNAAAEDEEVISLLDDDDAEADLVHGDGDQSAEAPAVKPPTAATVEKRFRDDRAPRAHIEADHSRLPRPLHSASSAESSSPPSSSPGGKRERQARSSSELWRDGPAT